ncbi:MAG: beta strand repeat-containing protein, partial [Candidatus Ratteibacteria bacterium]
GNTYLVGASGTVINSGKISASSGNVNINSTNATVLTKTSVVDVSGIGTNSGGEIRVLSSGNTVFARNAQLLAKGGEISGDGGFIEISAGNNLYLGGTFNVLAVNGENGSVLIDPVVLTIKNGSGSSGFDGDIGYFDPQNEVYESELEGWVGNITLQAQNLITMEDLTDNTLALSTSSGETFKMEVLNGSIEFQDTDDVITTNGGNIQISSYGYDATYGGHLTLGSLFANGGNITLQALGTTDGDISAIDISTVPTAGNAGNISIMGQTVSSINSIDTSSSTGNAGNIDIVLSGIGNSNIGSAGIYAYSTFAGGNAGDITITATNNNLTLGAINNIPGGGTAGDIQISATDITLGGSVTTNGSLTLISNSGDVAIHDDITTNNGILQITGADTITQASGTTIDTGSGNVTLSSSGNISIDNITTTGEALVSSSSGAIFETSSDGTADLTANKITLTSATYIDIDTASPDITANANNNITIENIGVSGTFVLNSSSSGDITFKQKTSGDIDITASTNNGSITIENGVGNITATSVIANSGDVSLDTSAGTGDIYVAYIETDGLVTIKSGGAVEEVLVVDPDVDIVADQLIIGSSAGVGVSDTIEIDVNTLAVVDVSSNGVYLTDTAGGLTIGTIGLYSGITTNNGKINISTSSPLIINAPISAGSADITLTAIGSDGYIAVNDSIINSGTYNITLIANGVNTYG